MKRHISPVTNKRFFHDYNEWKNVASGNIQNKNQKKKCTSCEEKAIFREGILNNTHEKHKIELQKLTKFLSQFEISRMET